MIRPQSDQRKCLGRKWGKWADQLKFNPISGFLLVGENIERWCADLALFALTVNE